MFCTHCRQAVCLFPALILVLVITALTMLSTRVEGQVASDNSFAIQSEQPGIKIVISGQTSVVLGSTVSLTVDFIDAKTDAKTPIRLTEDALHFERQDIDVRFDPADPTGHCLLVTGKQPGYTLLTIKVKLPMGANIKQDVPVLVTSAAGFQKLKIAMDMMDEVTSAALFGSATSREFYVVRVRLFNDLHNYPDHGLRGHALLVYSASIEVGVKLEKLYDPKTTSEQGHAGSSKQWTRVMDDDSPEPFHQRRFHYRPYNYEVMVNTFDARDSKSVRSEFFRVAYAIGIAAFLGSTLSHANSDTLKGIGAYNVLLLPGLEKLFPSMKEIHRQNLMNLTMRSLEEIPYGSDISRVLFFPKGSFRGVLPGYLTRIGEINTSDFSVTVAVIGETQRQDMKMGQSVESQRSPVGIR